MFIIYRKGDVINQIVAWGADRERKVEGAAILCASNHALIPATELEAVLILGGAIIPQPGGPQQRKNDDDDDLDDDDDGPSSRMHSHVATTNAKTPKNIRQTKDEDSDFEFDL